MKKFVTFSLAAILLMLSIDPQKMTYANNTGLIQKPSTKSSIPAGWKEYISTTGNFSVIFPEGPISEEKSPQVRVKADIGPRTYGVARLEGFNLGETAQATVEGAAIDFLNTCEGKEIEKFNTPLGNYPGASIKFETANPSGITEARFYLVGKYMYAVITFTRNGNSQDNAVRFLNSFKVLKDPSSR